MDESLKIENQLCFPLYAASKEVIKKYKPMLDKLDLTYTQYITMMVLWEYGEINVKTLGDMLFLDSGTLTPVLKKLESKGYILRKRDDFTTNNDISYFSRFCRSYKNRQHTYRNASKNIC